MQTQAVLEQNIGCFMEDADCAAISVDDHVQEDPRLWTDRLSAKKWGDRIPRLVRGADGSESWIIDGLSYPLSHSLTSNVPAAEGAGYGSSELPKWVYDPKERLKAMEIDRLSHSVLYPSVAGMAGERFQKIKDPQLREACVRAYNDWLIDEWSAVSPAFIPQCIVPVYPAEATIAEIERSVSRGHRGIVFPALAGLLRELAGPADAEYDSVWRTCEELDVPLCLHSGCTMEVQFPSYVGFSGTLAHAFQAITRPLSSSFILAAAFFSEVLVRHPKLKVVFADCPIGWGMFTLETLDYLSQLEASGVKPPPSELFKRQCYFVFCSERLDSRIERQISSSNVLWTAHLPLATSTWPHSRNRFGPNLEAMHQLDRRRILRTNAESLYKLDRGKPVGINLDEYVSPGADLDKGPGKQVDNSHQLF